MTAGCACGYERACGGAGLGTIILEEGRNVLYI